MCIYEKMNYKSLFTPTVSPARGLKISLEETGSPRWCHTGSQLQRWALCTHWGQKKKNAHGRCYFYRHAREVAVNQSVWWVNSSGRFQQDYKGKVLLTGYNWNILEVVVTVNIFRIEINCRFPEWELRCQVFSAMLTVWIRGDGEFIMVLMVQKSCIHLLNVFP